MLLKVRRGNLCRGSWPALSARVPFGGRQGEIWGALVELRDFAAPGSG